MTTHNNNACPHPVKHSASRYTEPLNKVKCTEGGGEITKATDISSVALLHKEGYEMLSIHLSSDITKTTSLHRKHVLRPCLFWERTARKDQKKVGLPWVQSSRNYSLTWKRRQLIHSGKLSVLHKFLSLSLTSLISALTCNMLYCDTSGHPNLSQKILLDLSKSL